jgi:Rap1a immunity proteins
MRSFLLGALVALTITVVNAAEQDTTSANFMLPYCKLTSAQLLKRGPLNPLEPYFNGQCFGIASTVRDMLGLMRAAERHGDAKLSPSFCADIPGPVTRGQLVNVILRHAEVHPEDTHEDFWVFALEALHDAWPCKR